MLQRLKHYLRSIYRPERFIARGLYASNPSVERRRSPRVPSRNLVRILSRDQLQLDHLFNLADFSESGLRIRTDLDAHSGSVIEAIVNFKERNLNIELKLFVVWVHQSRRGHAWGGQMGVEMMNLPVDLRALIKMMVIEKLIYRQAA